MRAKPRRASEQNSQSPEIARGAPDRDQRVKKAGADQNMGLKRPAWARKHFQNRYIPPCQPCHSKHSSQLNHSIHPVMRSRTKH